MNTFLEVVVFLVNYKMTSPQQGINRVRRKHAVGQKHVLAACM